MYVHQHDPEIGIDGSLEKLKPQISTQKKYALRLA